MYRWPNKTPASIPQAVLNLRQKAVDRYGTPTAKPEFWNSLSANSYLQDLGGPLQLHIGSADEEVPPAFHTRLSQQLKAIGHPVASYVYPGDNHNLSRYLLTALDRSVAFFREHL
jgi:fermentation-respiration switch protein FrsA (DUF1100 family)